MYRIGDTVAVESEGSNWDARVGKVIAVRTSGPLPVLVSFGRGADKQVWFGHHELLPC